MGTVTTTCNSSPGKTTCCLPITPTTTTTPPTTTTQPTTQPTTPPRTTTQPTTTTTTTQPTTPPPPTTTTTPPTTTTAAPPPTTTTTAPTLNISTVLIVRSPKPFQPELSDTTSSEFNALCQEFKSQFLLLVAPRIPNFKDIKCIRATPGSIMLEMLIITEIPAESLTNGTFTLQEI